MKTLRTFCWFAFFSLLWARIAVSIDHANGRLALALIVGAACSMLLTAAAMCFASAILQHRRLRREQREALVRRMSEDTAEAQRFAELAYRRQQLEKRNRLHPSPYDFHLRREGSPTALKNADAVCQFWDDWKQRAERLA